MTSTRDHGMGNEARLWALIEERIRRGADAAAIDAQIWDLFGEDWAVVYTDLAGFSRRAEKFGIIHFLQVIYESKKLLFPIVSEHGGSLVKTDGDSCILLFRTASRAVEASVAMQRACFRENGRRVEEEQILLGVGIGFGRILRIGEHDVWGEQVNAASKLGEDAAGPYDILITDQARRACPDDPDSRFEEFEVAAAGSRRNHRVGYDRAG
jgi:class 3 adenylate cyclase